MTAKSLTEIMARDVIESIDRSDFRASLLMRDDWELCEDWRIEALQGLTKRKTRIVCFLG